MRFALTITVEVERESGKFASRDEILGEIRDAIESANPDQIDGVGADGASAYTIIEWELQDA